MPAGVCSDWLQQTDLEGQLGLVIQRQPKGSFWPQKERVTIFIVCTFLYIFSIENHKDATQKLLLIELIKDFSKVAGHKINIQKFVGFLYTSYEISGRESKKQTCLKLCQKYLAVNQGDERFIC